MVRGIDRILLRGTNEAMRMEVCQSHCWWYVCCILVSFVCWV